MAKMHLPLRPSALALMLVMLVHVAMASDRDSDLLALENEDQAIVSRMTGAGDRTSGASSCVCLRCNGTPFDENERPRICQAQSLGCSIDIGDGCFGVQDSDNGLSGRCKCASGHFSHPAKYTLGGKVKGLPAGTSVVLASSSRGGAAVTGTATMTVTVSSNGSFRFPLRLANGQPFRVRVSQDPEGRKCQIYYGRGKIHGENVQTIQVSCAEKCCTEPWRERGKACDCMRCNGGGYAPYDAYCSGRSIGCTVGHGENMGCYGLNRHGTTGRCNCGSGKFTEPEVVQIRATLSNLRPGTTLTLGADTWTLDGGQHHKNEQTPGGHRAVQTVVLRENGDFSFPFKLAEGQQYAVRVVNDPLGQRCTVSAGRGVVVAMAVETVRVVCHSMGHSSTMLRSMAVGPAAVSTATEQRLYQREEKLRAEEYGTATKVFAHSEDDSGGQFFTVVAIGFVPALSYYLYTLSTGMGEQRPGYQTVKGDDGAGAELSTRSSAEAHSTSGPTNIEL